MEVALKLILWSLQVVGSIRSMAGAVALLGVGVAIAVGIRKLWSVGASCEMCMAGFSTEVSRVKRRQWPSCGGGYADVCVWSMCAVSLTNSPLGKC